MMGANKMQSSSGHSSRQAGPWNNLMVIFKVKKKQKKQTTTKNVFLKNTFLFEMH